MMQYEQSLQHTRVPTMPWVKKEALSNGYLKDCLVDQLIHGRKIDCFEHFLFIGLGNTDRSVFKLFILS
jgi:hypothetical protein